MSSLPSRFLDLAHSLAQGPAGLHVLGYEPDLILAAADAIEDLRLHGVEGPLQLLGGDGPHVLLEAPVREVDKAVAEDHLAVVRAALSRDAPDRVIEAYMKLLEGVQLHAAAGEGLALGHAALVVGVQRHDPDGAVGGPHRDLL